MRKTETAQAGRAPGGPMGDLAGLAVLALGAYAAHAWLANSAYWMAAGHRPLTMALRAAALAADWPQAVKVMTILGSSLSVMRSLARPSVREARAARPQQATRPPMGFGLEVAR